MKQHLRNYGAVWILTALWVLFGAVQWFTNLSEYASDQVAHGMPFQWGEFLAYFFARFAENHASESWQLAVQALLIVAYADRVFRKGTEDQRRLEAKVDRLLHRQS